MQPTHLQSTSVPHVHRTRLTTHCGRCLSSTWRVLVHGLVSWLLEAQISWVFYRYVLQEELVYDVLSAPVKQCAQVQLKPGQLQAASDPSPAGPTPPWGSSSCVELIQEACGLLQGGWFDPEFEERVEQLSSRHGQQLVSPDSLGDVCGDLRSCSAGIGLFFDAVWFDAAQGQWCLVPNAYMRHMFPEG